MVPGTQKTFREQRNVDHGTRILELLFLEYENLDTGTGKGIFNQGVGNRGGFLEHVFLSVTQTRDLNLEQGSWNKT